MKESEPSRRRFLARVVAALNALVALVVATPAAGYLLSPLLRRRSSRWVAIGRASKFGAEIPQREEAIPGLPPDSSFAGSKLRHEWAREHLMEPHPIRYQSDGLRPIVRMPDFRL